MYSKLVNLAELLPIHCVSNDLQNHWQQFLEHDKDKVAWDFRVYINDETLGIYFKRLIQSINDTIQLDPKYIMLQVFDKRLYKHKGFLNVIHKDVDRNSCITLPLTYAKHEPVLFYNEIEGIDPGEYRKTNLPWPEKPCQIAQYSDNHPTLVNVQNLHNVRVLDEVHPRILLQLSYDIGFDDMISRNPSLWRII